MMSAQQKTNIVIFGATGFTGKHVIPYLSKFSKQQNFTWGVAGRSNGKLLEVLKEYQNEIAIPPEDIPKIIADVNDVQSINEMARRCNVIIDCCGPFRLYGEAVVKACVENGTNYVDVSGEVQFIEEMQLKYHKEAQKTNCYIISACGGESIPNDIGVLFLEKNFKGTVNSIESYTEFSGIDSSIAWANFNIGTWSSMVYFFHDIWKISKIREKLWSKSLPEFKPKLKRRWLPHKFEGKWAGHVYGTDLAVVQRSQRFFYENSQKRPIQFETYGILNSIETMLRLIFFGGIVLLLSQFSSGVKLLLKFPKFFSNGVVTDSNPSEEVIRNNKYRITLIGKGWDENSKDKTSIIEVKGTNLGYGDTCKFLALTAITIFQETHKLPPGGGVLPPAYAFADTSLIENLIKNGLEFIIRDDSSQALQ